MQARQWKQAPQWNVWHRVRVAIATGLLACVLYAPVSSEVAYAGLLEAEACANHRSTRDALLSLGIKDDMQLGPNWAAQNLASDRIERIKRYIVSVEQILFRCGQLPRLVEDGMDFDANMPDPKPFYERRTFPLPVRKPVATNGLRTSIQ